MTNAQRFCLFFNIANFIGFALFPQSKYVTIFLLAVSCLGLLFSATRNIKKNITYIFVCLLIFFIFTLIITLISQYDLKISTYILVLIQCFTAYVIGALNGVDDKVNKLFFKFIIVFMLILSAYGLLIYYLPNYESKNTAGQTVQCTIILGIKLSQIIAREKNGPTGIASLTQNPNTFSFLLLLGAVAVLYFLFSREDAKKIGWKIALSLFFVLFIFTLFRAGSRMCIALSIVLVLMFDFFQVKSRKKSYLRSRFILIILLIGALIFAIMNYDKIVAQISFASREELWAVFDNNKRKYVFIGAGLGSSLQMIIFETSLTLGMHNTYYSLWLEIGLIPFILILLALLISIIYSYFVHLKTKEKTPSKLISGSQMTIIFTILLFGITESTIFTFSLFNYLFFYLVGAIIGKGSKDKNYSTPKPLDGGQDIDKCDNNDVQQK